MSSNHIAGMHVACNGYICLTGCTWPLIGCSHPHSSDGLLSPWSLSCWHAHSHCLLSTADAVAANKWQEGIGAWVAAGNKGVPPELQYLYDIGLKGLPAAYTYLKELKQAKKEKKKLAQAAGGDAAPEEGSPEGGEDAFDELAAVVSVLASSAEA